MRVYHVTFNLFEVIIICAWGCVAIGMLGAFVGFVFDMPWVGPLVGPIGGLWSLYWLCKGKWQRVGE